MSNWRIRKMNDVNLLEVDVDKKPKSTGWEQWILLTSDWHWDNDHCDLDKLTNDLDKAKERSAPVFCFGDAFCLMQGRYDPRRARSGMRASLDVDNYLDAVVTQAHDFFEPYADNMALATRGNHEISNMRNNETDVLERFCERLRFSGSEVMTGGIGGWVFIRCNLGGKTQTLKLAYHHGAGGGGPATKGTPKHGKRAAYLPQADIFVSGHIHERWSITNVQETISAQGNRALKDQTHLCLPTYKQEYAFHNLNERPPKPMGGCWLRLHLDPKGVLQYDHIFT
jgi:predicted phosphodiesterase